MCDAGSPHPLKGGVALELGPQPRMFACVLADQQRHIAIAYAGRDQPVGRQVRMRTREPLSDKSVGGDDLRADDTPMRDAVCRI